MIKALHLACLWLTSTWLRALSSSLILILILDILIRKLFKTIEYRRRVDKLPGPPILNPIQGNIPIDVIGLLCGSQRDAADFFIETIQSFLSHTISYEKEALFRLWVGRQPIVCVWTPEMVELVLSDNFLLEKSYHYDFLRPWLGNGLLTSPGKIWRPRRKLLVPSFHFNILQAFVPVFERKSKLLVRNIKRKLAEKIKDTTESTSLDIQSTVVDITPVITACTLDAICETIMGVTIDAQENPNNDYCQSVYVVGETFLGRIIEPKYWLDTIFRYTELGKLYYYHLNKLHSFTRRVIAEKKKVKLGIKDEITPSAGDNKKVASNSIESKLQVLDSSTVDSYQARKKDVPKLPKAFLDLLLDKINLGAGEQKLTDEEIREEVDTFMFEGHDTTAMALSWTLFLLGHNRSVQEKLWAEVDELNDTQLMDEDLELDHLKKLKYLDCVIKEGLRLCPSVPFIGRQTTTDLKLGDHVVPPGCVVFVLIYQLHRNAEIFPNPEKFDPDRFKTENTIGRHPFAYVPFSAGPRNCIGQKFAMAEMKTILFHLTRNFEFESVTPLDKAKYQMEMVLRPKSALNIRIRHRKK